MAAAIQDRQHDLSVRRGEEVDLHAALASREMAALLASDRAENITGAAFNVDGGWEMH